MARVAVYQLHGDPKPYIAAPEDPKRDAHQKPHEVMQVLGLEDGEIVADIGAGSWTVSGGAPRAG